MTETLDLQVRYFQDSPEEGLPCREEHFVRRETSMILPVRQTALVLVDTWDNHFITSWLERATKVMEEAVVPALNAARDAGLTIIHAPSPRVTPSYPEHMARHRAVESAVAQSWPPEEFRARHGLATELAIREAETQLGFSAANEVFLTACEQAT